MANNHHHLLRCFGGDFSPLRHWHGPVNGLRLTQAKSKSLVTPWEINQQFDFEVHCLFVCLFVCLLVCLLACLFVCLFVCFCEMWPCVSRFLPVIRPENHLYILSFLVSLGIFNFFNFIIYILPGTWLSSILGSEPSKGRPFPFKTRVIWVPGICIYIIISKHFDDPEVSGNRSAKYLPTSCNDVSCESPLFRTISPSLKRQDCVLRLGEVMLLIKEVQIRLAKLRRLCTNLDSYGGFSWKAGIHVYLTIPHRIHVWYVYLHLVDFYGKCRWIMVNIPVPWILWVLDVSR